MSLRFKRKFKVQHLAVHPTVVALQSRKCQEKLVEVKLLWGFRLTRMVLHRWFNDFRNVLAACPVPDCPLTNAQSIRKHIGTHLIFYIFYFQIIFSFYFSGKLWRVWCESVLRISRVNKLLNIHPSLIPLKIPTVYKYSFSVLVRK